jgi:RNA polymerase sigma-32 factor
MQAVERFEPEKGFRLATYAMWWIKAAIQEYILRSWSLVKMGTTANQKKLFFNLRKAKSRISALDEGDVRPDQVKLIAKRLGVTEQDVIDMNRRLGGDASLNAPIREDGDSGEWMDWLVDDSGSQESRLAESQQSENRYKALGEALGVLNDRERRIFEARRLADESITLERLPMSSASHASESVRSKCAPSRRCRRRFNIGLKPWNRPNPPGSLNEGSGAAPSASSSIVLNTPFIVG